MIYMFEIGLFKKDKFKINLKFSSSPSTSSSQSTTLQLATLTPPPPPYLGARVAWNVRRALPNTTPPPTKGSRSQDALMSSRQHPPAPPSRLPLWGRGPVGPDCYKSNGRTNYLGW
jgi:hypothetical protein